MSSARLSRASTSLTSRFSPPPPPPQPKSPPEDLEPEEDPDGRVHVHMTGTPAHIPVSRRRNPLLQALRERQDARLPGHPASEQGPRRKCQQRSERKKQNQPNHSTHGLLTRVLLNEQLVIPKHHGAKLADIPDEHLTELLVRFLSAPWTSVYHVFLCRRGGDRERTDPRHSLSRRRSPLPPAPITTTSCRTTDVLRIRRLTM